MAVVIESIGSGETCQRSLAVYLAVMNEQVPARSELFQPLKEGRVNYVERFFTELLWSARALKEARTVVL